MQLSLYKPKMVDASEGLNQVILEGVFRSFFAKIFSKCSEEIIIWEPVMRRAFVSIMWEINFKILAHHSSLSQLITSTGLFLAKMS